jgi:predicted protein tyrosine phosphatase
MGYLHLGVDEYRTYWALEALDDPDAVVLVHCHMDINRGPRLTFATMLASGHDPVAAIDMIRIARPIANVGCVEDALGWFRISSDRARHTG